MVRDNHDKGAIVDIPGGQLMEQPRQQAVRVPELQKMSLLCLEHRPRIIAPEIGRPVPAVDAFELIASSRWQKPPRRMRQEEMDVVKGAIRLVLRDLREKVSKALEC